MNQKALEIESEFNCENQEPQSPFCGLEPMAPQDLLFNENNSLSGDNGDSSGGVQESVPFVKENSQLYAQAYKHFKEAGTQWDSESAPSSEPIDK